MKVVVTGGAGFIGSCIVRMLRDEGIDVVVLDRVDGTDVTSTSDWLHALDGADAICHQAARVGLGVHPLDVTDYVHDNDTGTAAGLWAMAKTGFSGRLVLASSMVVYGEGRYLCSEHGVVRAPRRRVDDLERGVFEPRCPLCGRELAPGLVPEDAPVDPRNVYAATKLHQEHLCATVCAEIGVPVTMLRYHNVYGPGMPRDTPYAGVAGLFASALHHNRAPQVFEDGTQRRDFVHVDDVARANLLALTSRQPIEGAFNICSGQPRTVADLAWQLASALDGPDPVITAQWRLGDVRHVVADPALSAATLGFRAHVTFEDGIAEFARSTTPAR